MRNDLSAFFRPNIASMEGYIPGEQPKEGNFIKLNTNENPYPPSPLVLDRLRQACNADLRRYPDPEAGAVRRRLSQLFRIPFEQTIVGNGSDELLSIIMRSFVDPDQKVVFPHPTYSYYRQLIQIQAGQPVAIDFPDDFSLPEDLAVEDAKVTLLVNPNAPSGTEIPVGQVEGLAERVSGLLVVDEAYVDFSTGGCIHLIESHPNVIVVRTMSKSYSLAGMRLGFGFAAAELIAGMWKVKDHYNVNRLSLVAAEAALDDIDTMRAQATRICRTRQQLATQLAELGLSIWDSSTNFLLVRLPDRPAAEVYAELKKRRILVRYFDQPRLRDCLRISVGTEEEIAVLVRELREILSG